VARGGVELDTKDLMRIVDIFSSNANMLNCVGVNWIWRISELNWQIANEERKQ
jgi:hypothetical protein